MEKLVRDRIIEFSRIAGDGREFRYATPEQIPVLFAKKLLEEAIEVAQELSQPTISITALMDELADLTEVIEEIMEGYNIGVEALLHVRNAKADRKGRFKDGLVLNLETNIPRKV